MVILLMILVFCIAVIAFPVGLLVAIINKAKRKLGVTIMVISAIVAIIAAITVLRAFLDGNSYFHNN